MPYHIANQTRFTVTIKVYLSRVVTSKSTLVTLQIWKKGIFFQIPLSGFVALKHQSKKIQHVHACTIRSEVVLV